MELLGTETVRKLIIRNEMEVHKAVWVIGQVIMGIRCINPVATRAVPQPGVAVRMITVLGSVPQVFGCISLPFNIVESVGSTRLHLQTS